MQVIKTLTMLSLAGFCAISTALSQDAGNFAGNALTLSRTSPGGSARILGLGGAQTALGGDISNGNGNPAGLGFFNRSEFSISPTFNNTSASSNYLGSGLDDARFNFNFNNLGVVLKNSKGDGKLRGGSFAISSSRVVDFQSNINYEGFNFNPNQPDEFGYLQPNFVAPADLVEFAVAASDVDINGNFSFENDLAELVFETFLIDAFQFGNEEPFIDRDFYEIDDNGNYTVDENDNLIPAYSVEGFETFQTELVKSRGAVYETSFAYGANYDDRLYFGANIGVLTFSREVERVYSEVYTASDLNNLVLEDLYEENGIGINATIGLIGRPVAPLLLGFSYTTPSAYSIEQIRSLTLTANFIDGTESFGFDYEPFDYVLTTPSRLNLGATYFIGKSGFITGDVERVNYAGARLSGGGSGINFSGDNLVIDDYESVWNYRVGGEFRYDLFRLRGGFAYQADPTDDNLNQEQTSISLGGGIRTEDYYVDLAVINSNGVESEVSPYPGQAATVTTDNTVVMFTVGFVF